MSTKNILLSSAMILSALTASCGGAGEPAASVSGQIETSGSRDERLREIVEEAFEAGGVELVEELRSFFDAFLAGEKDAKTAWATLCVMCHGAKGKGDGVSAHAFPVQPRSFADKAWQASVDDAHIKKIIVEGGASVGKSPLMTGAPHLKGNDEALYHLVRIVRSFGN